MMEALWTPNPKQIAAANMTQFKNHVAAIIGYKFNDYQQFYDWSIKFPEQFWNIFWDFCNIICAHKGSIVATHQLEFAKSRYFPEAYLNYAENLLVKRSNDLAIIAYTEEQLIKTLSFNELYREVAMVTAYLRANGVVKGDRVAGIVSNTSEAIVAALATASIGAIWSSCSPDFGQQGILDRFIQIEPKILFAANSYCYKGKHYDCSEKLSAIVSALPTVVRTVLIQSSNNHLNKNELFLYECYNNLINDLTLNQPLTFEQVAFDHPLFIMFSSGTTGVPKCIVHGHGGTLLQHLKEHRLHSDLKADDKLFFYTTTSWMMWNWLMSGLASQATLILYEGSPFHPTSKILFDIAERHHITHFGVSAKYLDALQKMTVDIMLSHCLEDMRMIMSTGSPLAPESFDYTYQHIGRHICLASISGGTDILSCFALGNPIAPVWRGELQTAGLALAVDVFDADGHAVDIGHKGELVCTKPFPSMPVMFWNDPQGQKFHKAYFEAYPNIWYHGDYVEKTVHNGLIIFGRSDAVLKPGGIRIGTAEIYRQVEKISEVLECIAVGQSWQHDERIILFVKLVEGITLNDTLKVKICQVIRDNTTIHHVPALICVVPDIPRTVNGKIVELAVKDLIHNRPIKNIESIANPECLKFFTISTD